MEIKQALINAKNWEERYRLIIQAGKLLAKPSSEELMQMQQIKGCEAKVWFLSQPQIGGYVHFQAYSEARIINGLLQILLEEIQDKTITQLAQFDLTKYFTELGIATRLSATRLNGLKQIEHIIKTLK